VTSWESLIRCLYHGEFYEEALEQVQAALHMTNDKPIFKFYLSAVYLALGKTKEALLQLENAMGQSPKLLKKIVELDPSILQHQLVADIVARFKKNK
jgi:tetratricopeptide (TPR) repeat protein